MRCFSGRGIEDPELISDISDLGGKQAQNLLLGYNFLANERATMSYPRPLALVHLPRPRAGSGAREVLCGDQPEAHCARFLC